MDNPFKWLFQQKEKPTRLIRTSPNKDPASDGSSPGLSNISSSPAKRAKIPRFLGASVRPPLF